MRLMNRFRCCIPVFVLVPVLAVSIVAQQVPVSSDDDFSGLSRTYNESMSSFEKIQALRGMGKLFERKYPLGKRQQSLQQSNDDMEVAGTIIGRGLDDNDPVVKAEAIRQAGRLGMKQHRIAVLTIYKESLQFPGYQHLLEERAIVALASIGGAETEDLMGKELSKGMVSSKTMKVLESVERMGSVKLLPEVSAYIAKLRSALAQPVDTTLNTKEEMIKRIPVQNALTLALHVQSSLMSVKGGAQ